MRKWTLRIHLYGGLLCAPYLIIFGFSSLHFNHHFAFVTPAPSPTEWHQSLAVSPDSDNVKMADSVRDGLGLAGWTIPWKMKREASGDLQFDLETPGKSYTIQTIIGENNVRVQERRKGFWDVVTSLHALGSVPNMRFTSFWSFYTELCAGFVFFATASGVYLWLISRRERKIGISVLLGAALASIALMIYVVMRG